MFGERDFSSLSHLTFQNHRCLPVVANAGFLRTC
jgi:hypothetical protein